MSSCLFLYGLHTTPGVGTLTVLFLDALFTSVAVILIVGRARGAGRALGEDLGAQARWFDATLCARSPVWIALGAGVALLAELMLIRWHSSTFQLFAYFKNFSLLASFLGLGIGYALPVRRTLLIGLALPAVATQFTLLHVLRFSGLRHTLQSPISEQLSLGLRELAGFSQGCLSVGFLLLMFVATALTCVPLGQAAGRLMHGRDSLQAYGWNLAGSLVCVLAYAGVSSLWAPPAAWLALLALGVSPLLGGMSGRLAALNAVSLAAALFVLTMPLRTDLTSQRFVQVDLFSPYQILSFRQRPAEPAEVLTSQVYYQRVLNLDAASADAQAAHYFLPYRLTGRAGQVLVVGSGTGNDVAAALRSGASGVTAVEIDPTILWLGESLHPQRPYADPRVRAIVQDARRFLRSTDDRFDLIVFGLLDSHVLMSSRSGIRLDSFVYTVESFREARARLREGGLLTVSFTVLSEQHSKKLFNMLSEAFAGREPLAFRTRYDDSVTFVAGGGGTLAAPPDLAELEMSAQLRQLAVAADSSTDDWPFFYMPVRRYPASYLLVLAMLVPVSWAFLREFLPFSGARFSWRAFLLGAGFMLLETKGITELALAFGSTWLVTSIVIAGILVMAFLANLLARRLRGVPDVVPYALLALAIVAGLLFGRSVLYTWPGLPGEALATTIAVVPLFFSGLAFSRELAHGHAGRVLAANLFGAMSGGLLEYNSMFLGFRNLAWIALALYAAAFLVGVRRAGA